MLLDACVAPRQAPPPAPAPTPTPAPPPPPPAPADWRDRAYTPGDWSYAREGGESVARYGLQSAPLVEFRCSGGAVTLAMPGAAPGSLVIRTSYGDTARQTDGPGLRFGAGDPLLDQIAYSRGRFMLASGATELVLPAWPEVQRVVEDCR